MRYIIYLIGISLAVLFITQAQGAFHRKAALDTFNQGISSEVNSLNKTMAWVNTFQTRQPQSILDSYKEVLNKIYLVVNANQATVLTRLKDVAPDKDMKVVTKPSELSGINQINLEVTVGNLTNSNQLSAMFLAFSALEKEAPIVIQGFVQEKDYIIFNISILGT